MIKIKYAKFKNISHSYTLIRYVASEQFGDAVKIGTSSFVLPSYKRELKTIVHELQKHKCVFKIHSHPSNTKLALVEIPEREILGKLDVVFRFGNVLVQNWDLRQSLKDPNYLTKETSWDFAVYLWDKFLVDPYLGQKKSAFNLIRNYILMAHPSEDVDRLVEKAQESDRALLALLDLASQGIIQAKKEHETNNLP